MAVRYEVRARTAVVTIARPEKRNAVDPETAAALVEAFGRFEGDEASRTAARVRQHPVSANHVSQEDSGRA